MNKDSSIITSVLIPSYNHEQYITDSLNSILKSNTHNIELIISDDCSQDHSYKIAENWVALHKHLFFSVFLYKQSKNLGIVKNFDFLIKKSSGEFVTFLGSDDVLSTNAIDFQTQYLIEHDVSFLFCNRDLINELGIVITKNYVGFIRQILIKNSFFSKVDIIYNWGIPWSGFFARKTAVQKLGQIPQKLSFEDRWVIFRVLQTSGYAYFNKTSCSYRIRTDNSPTPSLNKSIILRDLKFIELEALKKSKGILYFLLFFYLLPDLKNTNNYVLKKLYKIPKKIIKNLYLFLIKIF